MSRIRITTDQLLYPLCCIYKILESVFLERFVSKITTTKQNRSIDVYTCIYVYVYLFSQTMNRYAGTKYQ